MRPGSCLSNNSLEWTGKKCTVHSQRCPECFRSEHVSKFGGSQVQIESRHNGQTLVHCAPAAGKHLKRVAMFYIALMMAG